MSADLHFLGRGDVTLDEWFPIFRKRAVLLFYKFRRYTNDGITFLRNVGALTTLSLCKSNGRLVPE